MPRGTNYSNEGADLAKRLGAVLATIAALKALPIAKRVNGMLVFVEENASLWRFSQAGTASDASDNLIVTPTATGGIWLRVDKVVDIRLPITFATADAAILFTTPVGARLLPREFYWEVTANWTGGTASTIGASSSTQTGYTTKGDLLGGAAGDVAATLVAASGVLAGTVGAGFDTLVKRRTIFKAAATLRHDRITSAFTAGSGALHCVAEVLANAGA